MARTGRPKADLSISDEEREELGRLSRRWRTNRSLALPAKIVLHCASGLTNQDVAKKLRTSGQTVGKWRQRFVDGGVASLYDEPRPGGPRRISDEKVEEVIVKTLETKPKGRTHWSTRKMAKAAGISPASVGRIWRTFALQPHIVKTFKISNDPLFVEKVRDIVGSYMNPPEHAVVFSFDEKPQIQALERAQPTLPMDLGMPERQ